MSKHSLLDAMIAQTKLSKKQTNKQQKIVEAAIQMFAEKGYSNTSTSEIAKAAGVAEGTIFRHYGTKDNLLLSVILPFIKETIPSMAEDVFQEVFSEDSSFEDFLRALITNRVEFLYENKEIFQIVIKEILYKEELKKEILPYFTENILTRLDKALTFYKERGELGDLPNPQIIKLLLTFLGGFFVSRFVLLPDYKVGEGEIDEVIRFVMNGIGKG